MELPWCLQNFVEINLGHIYNGVFLVICQLFVDKFCAISLVAGKMCLTKLFQNLYRYQDRSARESKISSSFKSASVTELIYILRKWVNPSISCLAILCTLSFQECEALVCSAGARRLRNSMKDFLNNPSLSEGCNSDHIPLRNSNNVSYTGWKRVSYISEI